MNMSTPELKENYPGLFANPAPDTSDEEVAEGIKLNAKLLNDLFEKDKQVAENVMDMLYGNDGFYNLDAGLAIAVLKFVSVFGANVDDMIDEIDKTATLANKKSGSELQEFVGNFIKDHIVDIASIVGSLSTGGIGAAAGIATKVLGYAADGYKLQRRYRDLQSDDRFKNDPDAILWEMSKEFAGIASGRIKNHYITKSTGGTAKESGVSENLGNAGSSIIDLASGEAIHTFKKQ